MNSDFFESSISKERQSVIELVVWNSEERDELFERREECAGYLVDWTRENNRWASSPGRNQGASEDSLQVMRYENWKISWKLVSKRSLLIKV